MADTVVIFEKNGVRIKEGVDARDYRCRTDVAINPVFPRGIPPHQWKLREGKIELPQEPLIPKESKLRLFLKRIFRKGKV